MELEKESKIKNYIQEKEQLTWNTVADLSSLDKEIKDWFLTEWVRNDAGLLKYAELAMKEELSLGESVKLSLLDLKLSLSCPYFSDFKKFLSELKQWNRNSDVNNSSSNDKEPEKELSTEKETNKWDAEANSWNIGTSTLNAKTTEPKVESNNWKIIETAIQTAMKIAEDNSYWYELWGTGNKNGRKWFDCQSFVRHCFIQAWIDIPPSWWCSPMLKQFGDKWFECITFKKNEKLKPWDILLDPKKHTEMCISEDKIAWAHSNKDKKAWDSGWEEISVRSVKSSLSYRNPKYILRYKWGVA